MYSEKVMDHFTNPRNVGEIEDASGVGTVGNAKCGDIMRIFLKIEDGIITDVKFKTFGCGAAIATSSMATEMVKGKSIEEAGWPRRCSCPTRRWPRRWTACPPSRCTVLCWRSKPSRKRWRTISPRTTSRCPKASPSPTPSTKKRNCF